MARVKKKGQLSGAVGTVVFSSWNGIDYVRSPPSWKKKYKATPNQILNQQKFKFAMKLMRDFRVLMNISVEFEKGQSSLSSAMRSLLNEAIIGVHPDLSVDYSKLLVAKGTLPPPVEATVESTGTGIKFIWTEETEHYYYKDHSLYCILVAYHPETEQLFFEFNGPRSSLRSGELKIDDFYWDKELHSWLAFRSVDSKLKSNSVYTGVIKVKS